MLSLSLVGLRWPYEWYMKSIRRQSIRSYLPLYCHTLLVTTVQLRTISYQQNCCSCLVSPIKLNQGLYVSVKVIKTCILGRAQPTRIPVPAHTKCVSKHVAILNRQKFTNLHNAHAPTYTSSPGCTSLFYPSHEWQKVVGSTVKVKLACLVPWQVTIILNEFESENVSNELLFCHSKWLKFRNLTPQMHMS